MGSNYCNNPDPPPNTMLAHYVLYISANDGRAIVASRKNEEKGRAMSKKAMGKNELKQTKGGISNEPTYRPGTVSGILKNVKADIEGIGGPKETIRNVRTDIEGIGGPKEGLG